jgi:hypothetical protein
MTKFTHGTATLKKEIEGNKPLPIGTKGVITAYLPEMEKFAVDFGEGNWITFDMSEDEVKKILEINLELSKK